MKYQIMITIHSNNIDRTNVVFTRDNKWQLGFPADNTRKDTRVFFFEEHLYTADSYEDFLQDKGKKWIIDSFIVFNDDLKCFKCLYLFFGLGYHGVHYTTGNDELKRTQDDYWVLNQYFPIDPVFEYVEDDIWVLRRLDMPYSFAAYFDYNKIHDEKNLYPTRTDFRNIEAINRKVRAEYNSIVRKEER